MGVITSRLAPNSSVGVEVKGHDLALPEHDLGMQTWGSSLLVTMVTWLTGSSWCPPAPICFFHLHECHVVQMFGWSNKGKNGGIMWYFDILHIYVREYVYFLSHSPMNKVHFHMLMWFMFAGFALKVAFGQCFRCQFRRCEFEILCNIGLVVFKHVGKKSGTQNPLSTMM